MRSTRLAACAAAVSALAASPAATAAPVCRLVTDPAGDRMILAPEDSAVLTTDVDVVSADVAIDRKNVVAAIRVMTLRPFSLESPESKSYSMWFRIDGGREVWIMEAFVTPNAVSGVVTGPGFVSFRATVAVDYERREVRIAAPSKKFGYPYRGNVVSDIDAYAGLYFGPTGDAHHQVGPASATTGGAMGPSLPVDGASTDRTYRGGTPTCVVMPR